MTATRVRYPRVLYGTMAQRPPAANAPQQAYVATDATGVFGSTAGGGSTVETYVSDGSRWILVMQYGATVPPPPPPPPPPATWTVPHPALGTLINEGFETAATLSDVFATVGANASLSTANPHTGTKHFRDTPLTLTGISVANLPANNRQAVARFWFYLNRIPPLNQYLFDILGTTRFAVFATSTGHLKAQIGANNLPDLGTFTAAAWHRCDLLIDHGTDLTKATMTARLDSNASQTLTSPLNSTDLRNWRLDLGQSNSNLQNVTVDIDDVKITNNPSDYPLG